MSEYLQMIGRAPPSAKGGVFALGNFDGVHRGHQALIKVCIDKARSLGVPARVLTLEPHPRSVFNPHIDAFRLTPAEVKLRLLYALGIDDVIVQEFTPAFALVSAMDFANQILVDEFQAQHVIAGFDFVFGHRRGGDMNNLRTWLAAHGVGVTEVSPFRDSAGEIMSSSRTREALQQGDIETARHILGRDWTIAGVVQRGAQRGGTIGFPTANIALGDYLRPRYGVYAIEAGPVGARPLYRGVANIGVRPTVDGKTELLEAHLFDFNGDLYGQELEVALIGFIRLEQAFPNVEVLKQQICQDVETARRRLEGTSS